MRSNATCEDIGQRNSSRGAQARAFSSGRSSAETEARSNAYGTGSAKSSDTASTTTVPGAAGAARSPPRAEGKTREASAAIPGCAAGSARCRSSTPRSTSSSSRS